MDNSRGGKMAVYPEDIDRNQESQSYLENDVRAQENRSSAWALLIVGGVGLLLVVLGMLEVLPLKLSNPYLFYGVMTAVFFLFIVMGVLSMKNARFFAQKAVEDNTLLETVEKWCRETMDADSIDAAVGAVAEDETEEFAGELLYFKRAEYLKQQINGQFLNLDQALVEHFIDGRLYDMIFGEQPQ
jgi:hypothetical protein